MKVLAVSVIDHDSSSIKIGIAGDDKPSVIASGVVCRPADTNVNDCKLEVVQLLDEFYGQMDSPV